MLIARKSVLRTALTCVLSLSVAYAEDGAEETVRKALESAASLLAAGSPEAAIEALQPVERLEPDNPWMWFYRGAAHHQLGAPYKAIECYDHALQVLQGLGDPDPVLAARIRDQRNRARREVFTISTHTGLAYNTNVTFLGGGSEALGLVAGRGSGGFGSGARLSYAPMADERQSLTLGARLDHVWYFSVEQFDSQDYGGYARYAVNLAPQWEAAVRYDYDMFLLDRQSYLSNQMLTGSLAYRWQSSASAVQLNRSTVAYDFEAGDYLFRTFRQLNADALANGVGIEQTFLVRPVAGSAWTWDASVGYRFDGISTAGTEYDRNAHDFFLGLGIPLVNPRDPDKYLILPDKELTFRFTADWLMERYWNKSLFDRNGDRRSDLTTVFGFALSQKLIEDPEYGNLTLRAIITWTDADSNITSRGAVSPFTYESALYGVQLEWTW